MNTYAAPSGPGYAGPSAYVKTLGEGPSSTGNTSYRAPFDPPGSPQGGQEGPPTGPTPKPAKKFPPRLIITLVAAGIAIVLAGGIAFALFDQGDKKKPTCPNSANKACAAQGKQRPAPPAPSGPKFAYRTVDREVGYFEGTIMVVNKTGAPLPKWTLTFTYPGADVHNAWEVTLRKTGQDVIVDSKVGTQPLAPGASFEVRFGGAGKPATPTNCTFNGQPCRFTG